MKTLYGRALLNLILLFVLINGAVASPPPQTFDIYGVNSANQLVQVHRNTLAETIIGAITIPGVTALAYDLSTNTTYGVTGRGQLLTIDKNTAVATLVQNLPTSGSLKSLAFDQVGPNKYLYTANAFSPNEFYRITLAGGPPYATVQLGNTSFGGTGFQMLGMAVDPATQILHGANRNNDSLVILDKNTGMIQTFLANGAINNIDGIAFDPEAGGLYGVFDSGDLATFNLASGRATSVAVTSLTTSITFALAPLVNRTPSPYRVGEEIPTVFESPHPYGSDISPHSEEVTSFTIHHAGATYIAPHFSAFSLEPGDYVVVRSPNGNRSWRYDIDGKEGLGRSPNGFWGVHVPGDTEIVELHRSSQGRAYGFKIDRYARGYTPEEALKIPSNRTQNTLSICVPDDSRNAQCYQSVPPAVYDRGHPVARLLINGVSACTGWLFGSEGHVITNQHCITNGADAQNVDIEFNAEGGCSDNCSAWLACPGTVESNTSILVKNSLTFDYALLKPKLTTSINLINKYGYLRARTNGTSVDEKVFIPQHPAAKGKRIAVDSTDPHDQSGYAEVANLTEATCHGDQNSPLDIGYYADTEGGSSGSPVLALNDNFVVGLHHCGGCPNHAVPISAVITSLNTDLPKCARATDLNCPPSSPSQQNVPECDPCTNDFQCVLPATCVSGACVIAPYARSVGEQCCTGGQCQSQLCGAKQVCECAADRDCPAGQFCRSTKSGNICKRFGTKGECEGCILNSECQSGECRNFRCITPFSVGLGGHCCRDRECITGSCSGLNTCECKVSSDCPTGDYCDHILIGSNFCIPLKGPCEFCGANKQCGPGLHCQGAPFGRCISGSESISIGGRCCRDPQCASGSCDSAGACQCSQDSDCPAGQFCHEGFLGIGKNSCQPLKGECVNCSADDQCASHFCRGKPLGDCITGHENYPIGHSCCRDPQCASGSCDSAGACQCSQDSDCPAGQFCHEGFLGIGKNSCVDKKPCGLLHLCDRDAQCQSGNCGGVYPHCKC